MPDQLMTDDELQKWWPELGTVVAELRRTGQSDVVGLLIDAVRAGATSDEILGSVGAVLRDHHTLCSQLSDSGARAWSAVMTDVNRAFPGSNLSHWFYRLSSRIKRRRPQKGLHG